MRIAYLINQYPMVSHSFIRREILALERQGFEIERIALRGWNKQLADPEDRGRTEAHTLCSAPRCCRPDCWPIVAMAARRPMALARAMRLAWRMSRGAERPLPIHLIYLAEACWIEPVLRKLGCRTRARAFRHQLGRGGDAGPCPGWAALELYRPRPG